MGELRVEEMEDSEKVKNKEVVDLDQILINELGQFGWFQIRTLMLAALPYMMGAFVTEYIFSAAMIPHRCRVPECGEYRKMHVMDPNWITNAIPETGSGIESCDRFPSLGNGSLEYCPIDLFDQSQTIPCDGFVYARDESVVYEFDLGCQDWLRALAGTLNSAGMLISQPITGYISDRFGRKFALILSICNLALFGIVRALSVNFPMYMASQILQTSFGGGTVSSAYIITAEIVGPKYRVLTSSILTSMFSTGQVVMGIVAWLVRRWRYLNFILFIPCFSMISYYWLLPESIRWLLLTQKYEKAKEVLQKFAKANKTTISERSMEALMTPANSKNMHKAKPDVLKSVFRSPVLLRRVCTTPIWWITGVLVFYGLSINSTTLSDTMYLNYILTCAIEIPGYFLALLFLDRIGRRVTLSASFLFCAACNLVFIFIPNDLTVLRLIIFLCGKLMISTVMNSLYLYTSELYPTELRHSLLGFSSMVGRVGSIVAPLTPVLANYWHGTPSMMFAVMGVISGLLVLTQPETLGSKMPDTIAEAEAIGRTTIKEAEETNL